VTDDQLRGDPDDWPTVSVVIPARDDASHLPAAVEAVLTQDYPRALELVIAVGPSQDGTEDVAAGLSAEHPPVRVVENPAGTTPAALNRAIGASAGEIVVRIDSHSEPPPGYVRRAVEVLQATGADNVGGVQQAVGTTPFQRAVAAAMSSPFGVGDAKFHYGGEPGPTDTVYLGAFRRSALDRTGGFDESLLRNQDYELNWRIRATGGTVYFHPDLAVVYRPRDTWRGLARQYHEYGRWKREVLRRHPRSARWRQLVPPAALLANAGGAVLGLALHPVFWTVPAVYGGAAVAAALAVPGPLRRSERLRLPLVFATMHHAWALGFLVGPPRQEAST
jgi:succinoglycan biosynthesis protein ExoA